MTQIAQKQADIRYRVALKNKPHIVIYIVRSSNDTQDYQVTVVHGRVNNCTCKSHKPCYHMRDVATKEAERVALEHKIDQDMESHVEDDRRSWAPLNGSRGFSLLK